MCCLDNAGIIPSIHFTSNQKAQFDNIGSHCESESRMNTFCVTISVAVLNGIRSFVIMHRLAVPTHTL